MEEDKFLPLLSHLQNAALELEEAGMPALEILTNANDALEKPSDIDFDSMG